jgi:hypothetical protein
MWKEERGKPFYRFQTDDYIIASKKKARKKFKLTGRGINCSLWIFVAEFSRSDIARKALKTLTGNSVKLDKKDNILLSE